MRQRKLLLPPFHGEAVARYVEMIVEVAEAEIDRWRPGSEFSLAPRMQAVALEVIMRGIFDMKPGDGGPMRRMRETIRRLLYLSATPLYMSRARIDGSFGWIPFGGGIRRCLGASLAMAEQRVMLEAIMPRTELTAPDPRPEAPRMRNVTMIPSHGCRVRVAARTGA